MGAVYFYHLTQHPLETTLPVLLQKAVAAGWRTEVRGTDAARMAWLDERLWVQQTDGFLPHALEGEAEASESPVVLSTEPVDNVRCKMIVDGALVSAAEVQACERVCVLFDGHNLDATQAARNLWKTLTQSGCSAQYWSEESGKWTKKAEA